MVKEIKVKREVTIRFNGEKCNEGCMGLRIDWESVEENLSILQHASCMFYPEEKLEYDPDAHWIDDNVWRCDSCVKEFGDKTCSFSVEELEEARHDKAMEDAWFDENDE